MTKKNNHANHPLLPLIQLLESIESAAEFQNRQAEVLEAIHLASPVLGDRTAECRRLAKSPFLKRRGSPCTPFLMARLVESRIKDTLGVGRPNAKPAASFNPSKRKPSLSMAISRDSEALIRPMTYAELRVVLPTRSIIPTLGGRVAIEIHNPSCGHLTAINSNGKSYSVTDADWNNACVIRSRNPGNPWASKHYNGINAYTSYGLIHAAALLRYAEEEALEGLEEEAAGVLADVM